MYKHGGTSCSLPHWCQRAGLPRAQHGLVVRSASFLALPTLSLTFFNNGIIHYAPQLFARHHVVIIHAPSRHLESRKSIVGRLWYFPTTCSLSDVFCLHRSLLQAKRMKILKALSEHLEAPRRELAHLLDMNESTTRSMQAQWYSVQPPPLVLESRKPKFSAGWCARATCSHSCQLGSWSRPPMMKT